MINLFALLYGLASFPPGERATHFSVNISARVKGGGVKAIAQLRTALNGRPADVAIDSKARGEAVLALAPGWSCSASLSRGRGGEPIPSGPRRRRVCQEVSSSLHARTRDSIGRC